MKLKRDYQRLVNDILAKGSKIDLDVLYLKNLRYGDEDYPFLMLKSYQKRAKRTAVITAGAHGDESIGIRALIEALEKFDVDEWNFYVFPAVNPFGFRHISRKTGDGKGINRRVGERDLPEIDLVLKNIPSKFDLFIDIHSDVDKPYVYAYERRDPKKKSLARVALQDTEDYFDIAPNSTVYEEPCKDGVVSSADGEKTMEELMFDKGATFSITVEIPGKAKEADQLRGGARLIMAILNNFGDMVEEK